MEEPADDECEPQSLVHINAASELFPMKTLQVDDPNLPSTLPFNTLLGESVLYLGQTTDGVIAISNYRLFVNTNELGMFNVPLIMIDQVEHRDIFYLHFYCKDASYFWCSFETNDQCLEWYSRLLNAATSPKKLEDLFAFPFYAWCSEEGKDDLYELLHYDVGSIDMIHEIERLGLDAQNSNGVWRITTINSNFKISPTYPQQIVVPESVDDETLLEAAEFRALHRFPAIVWRHRKNGCVLGRCSQPEVGLFGWRGKMDEALFKAIAEACIKDKSNLSLTNGSTSNDSNSSANTADSPKLLIVDARSYSAALANRAKGGGCECPEYYPNCDIQFMGLANIHAIRKSFQSLRLICANPPDQANWYSALEHTRWLHHISLLIKSAMCVVNAINKENRPVIVHCSDGWDRTPQITALAQLILDPYYRTIEGFQILVEREWLEFGHKFGDRCGSGTSSDDLNERCPVFLQWLDCIHQIMRQYPCSFEFDSTYLIKLVHHVYSCLFGTFLCNCQSERQANRIKQRTFSIWSFFKSYHNRFRNYLYVYKDRVLKPSFHVRDMHFWSSVYIPSKNTVITSFEEHESTEVNPIQAENSNLSPNSSNLVKAKSFDDLLANGPHESNGSGLQDRLNDRNLAALNLIITDINVETKETTMIKENGVVEDCNRSCEDSSSKDNKHEDEEADDTTVAVNDTEGESSTPEAESLPNSESSSCCVEDKTLKNRLITGIDGSTDTLVGECALISSSSNNSNCDNSCTKLPSDEQGVRTKSFCDTKSLSTSTTEISDSSAVSFTNELYALSSKQLQSNRDNHTNLCLSCSMSNLKVKKKTFSRQTSNSSALSSIYSTPVHSRTPSSGFPATPNEDCHNLIEGQVTSNSRTMRRSLDVDGLTLTTDHIQQRLKELFNAHRAEVELLKRDLYLTRLALSQQVCGNCNMNGNTICPDPSDEVVSLPDSNISGENLSVGHESNEASDVGWEHVNEKDTHPTLWVPDHAVSKCSSCDIEFWLGRRKHHCRSCGKIFCAQCSDHLAPIPNEQLYHPVRVCKMCFNVLHSRFKSQVSSLMSCGTGCKNKIICKSQSVSTAEALN